MSQIKWKKVPDLLVWNKIKSLRKERKLKQIEVAIGSDISPATIWMLEQGYERRTTDETKQKLADFFKCDIDDIFPVEMVGNKSREEHLKEVKKE